MALTSLRRKTAIFRASSRQDRMSTRPQPTSIQTFSGSRVSSRMKNPGGGGTTVAARLERNLTERAPIGGTPGQAIPAIAAANDAGARTQGAEQLQRWTQQTGRQSEQIQQQAGAAADAAAPGSPQQKAYQAIAAAPRGGGGGYLRGDDPTGARYSGIALTRPLHSRRRPCGWRRDRVAARKMGRRVAPRKPAAKRCDRARLATYRQPNDRGGAGPGEPRGAATGAADAELWASREKPVLGVASQPSP